MEFNFHFLKLTRPAKTKPVSLSAAATTTPHCTNTHTHNAQRRILGVKESGSFSAKLTKSLLMEVKISPFPLPPFPQSAI